MAQFVTRIDDGLARAVDDLVAGGVVGSREEAVRLALRAFVAAERRRRAAEALIGGYRPRPTSDDAET
jgi:metal-responsive CopG/Arc/MetJ family transcriptional regulator